MLQFSSLQLQKSVAAFVATTTPPGQKNGTENREAMAKPVIKISGMNAQMQQDACLAAADALSMYYEENDIAGHVKAEFEKKVNKINARTRTQARGSHGRRSACPRTSADPRPRTTPGPRQCPPAGTTSHKRQHVPNGCNRRPPNAFPDAPKTSASLLLSIAHAAPVPPNCLSIDFTPSEIPLKVCSPLPSSLPLFFVFAAQYRGLWHCFTGRNFGAFVTHEQDKFTYFYIGQIGFLLFGTV